MTENNNNTYCLDIDCKRNIKHGVEMIYATTLKYLWLLVDKKEKQKC